MKPWAAQSLWCIWELLEIKSTSITRLKQLTLSYFAINSTDLKSKAPRLRDWNKAVPPVDTTTRPGNLKSKAPRLRDWNFTGYWEKIGGIDLNSKAPRLRDWNWCIRVSAGSSGITLNSKAPRLRDWNKRQLRIAFIGVAVLNSKAPRLRDWNLPYWLAIAGVEYTWTQKHLDYEIETRGRSR